MVKGSPTPDPTERTARVYASVLGLVFVPIGAGLGYLWGLRGFSLVLCALVIGAVVGYLIHRMATALAVGAGRGMLALVQPSGKSSPYEPEFSQAQALATAGDVAGAVIWYEAEMVRQPSNVLARLQCADLLARHGKAERAEAYYLEARRLSADRGQHLYCTQRLIDLRLGPLGTPERAFPELRRIVEQYPNSREAQGALKALHRLKGEINRGA